MSAVIRASNVMTTKVITARSDDSIYSATLRMLKMHVGCLVVVEDGRIIGIVTKGDLLKVVVRRKSPSSTAVREVMSRPVVTSKPETTLEEAAELMAKQGISKLPITDMSGKLVGILTSTDVIRSEPIEVGYLEELVRARFVPHDLAR